MKKKQEKPNQVQKWKNKLSEKTKKTDMSQMTSKLGKGGTKFGIIRSVGGKIFATFFVSIVAFVLIAGLISYQISANVIKNSATQSMQQTMAMTSEKLDMIYEKYEGDTGMFINDSDLNSLLAEYVESDMAQRISIQRTLEQRISGIMFSDDAIKGIHIIDTDGYVIQSFGSSSIL